MTSLRFIFGVQIRLTTGQFENLLIAFLNFDKEFFPDPVELLICDALEYFCRTVKPAKVSVYFCFNQ